MAGFLLTEGAFCKPVSPQLGTLTRMGDAPAGNTDGLSNDFTASMYRADEHRARNKLSSARILRALNNELFLFGAFTRLTH